MKQTYLIISVIAVTLIFTSALSSPCQGQLQLDVGLSDSTFNVLQSIWLDVQLTNIGKDTVRIWGLPFPTDLPFRIVLINGSGDTLRPILNRDVVLKEGFLLAPGKSYYYCFDLSEYWHNYQVQKGAPFNQFTRSLAPGEYKVYAEYAIGHPKIITPTISFEVAEPTGAGAEALKLYQEAYQCFLKKDSTSTNTKLKEVIKRFPNSVYSERALWKLKYRQTLLEKFPDSGFNQSGLRKLTEGMTKEKRQVFLQETTNKYPGTRSAKFAQQMLWRP